MLELCKDFAFSSVSYSELTVCVCIANSFCLVSLKASVSYFYRATLNACMHVCKGASVYVCVCGEYHSALAESSPQPSRKIRGSQQKKKVAQNALST